MENLSFRRSELIRCSEGTLFGENTPKLPSPPLLAFDKIIEISMEGGRFGRGYAVARKELSSMAWGLRQPFSPRSSDARHHARRRIASTGRLLRGSWRLPRL